LGCTVCAIPTEGSPSERSAGNFMDVESLAGASGVGPVISGAMTPVMFGPAGIAGAVGGGRSAGAGGAMTATDGAGALPLSPLAEAPGGVVCVAVTDGFDLDEEPFAPAPRFPPRDALPRPPPPPPPPDEDPRLDMRRIMARGVRK
jgi:hypothetical protein